MVIIILLVLLILIVILHCFFKDSPLIENFIDIPDTNDAANDAANDADATDTANTSDNTNPPALDSGSTQLYQPYNELG